MWNIIKRLDRQRFAPSIAVLQKGGDLEKEIAREGIPLIEAPFTVPARPYRSLFWRSFQAARPFRPGRFHLWHSFHYLDDYTEPIIARMAGARAWIYTKKNMNWGSNSWYLRSCLAARVLALNTEMMQNFFATGMFARKARLVPRGVETSLFHPQVPPRLHIRQRRGIAADGVVVGCVANLEPVKGHSTLVRALARLPGLHLLIAGKPLDENYAALLNSLVHTLGIADRVHFLGQVQDIPALLVELDIFVLPTLAKGRKEGFGVALLEAMSSGCACIATDTSGPRDMIQHGKSGLLFQSENTEALCEALQRLASSVELRCIMGAAARKRVLENFTIEQERARHAAIYEEIIRNQ